MKKKTKNVFLILLLTVFIPLSSFSQDDWREKMNKLIYTPKYFGPNAFPIPELHAGKLKNEYEIELRFDNHLGEGDHTQDLFARVYLPFGKKAAFEVSTVLKEDYRTSEALKDERYASNTQPHNGDYCYGDLVLSSMFQLVESEEFLDALLTVGIKTASGNMLVDARYTDAAAYWVNVDLGRNLIQNKTQDKYLKIGGMLGFYCYMSNKLDHRQNDAWLAGGGIQSRWTNLYFDADLRGFQGYWNEGDQPLLFHSKLRYRYKNHNIFFRYQSGLHDYIYQTVSGGYIFMF